MLKILNKGKVRLFKLCSKQISTSEVRKYFLLFDLVRKQGKENLKIVNRFSEMDDDSKDKLALDENQRENDTLFIIEALIQTNSIRSNKPLYNQINTILKYNYKEDLLYSEMIYYNSQLKNKLK